MTGETTNRTTGNKRRREPKYAIDEERREARRIRQRNYYYNRIKDERKELLNLQALRRYYRKKIRTTTSPDESGKIDGKLDTEKLTAKLDEIETEIILLGAIAMDSPFATILVVCCPLFALL